MQSTAIKHKAIRVTCSAKDFLDMDDIESLQGELKSISKESMAKLKNSIKRYGFSFPIFIWKNKDKYYSIDGVHRCKALKELSEIDGYEIPEQVPVVHIQAKDRKQAKELLLAASSQYAAINKDYLMQEFITDLNLESLKSTIEIPQIDIEALIQNSIQTMNDDEFPEEVDSITQLGDVLELGDHCLLCGDSKNPEEVDRLMIGEKAQIVFTDPPYGVSIGKKNEFLTSIDRSSRIKKPFFSDNDSPKELYDNLLPVFKNIRASMSDDCTVFVTVALGCSELTFSIYSVLRDAGIPVRHMLIWDKGRPTFSLGRLDYDYRHEPILLTWGKKHKKRMKGMFKSSVWTIPNLQKCDVHPTMKPVALVANALLNNSDPDDICLDLFGGSGTTLIACEQLNRRCRIMEIDPHYCDVIVQRYFDWCLANDKEP